MDPKNLSSKIEMVLGILYLRLINNLIRTQLGIEETESLSIFPQLPPNTHSPVNMRPKYEKLYVTSIEYFQITLRPRRMISPQHHKGL